MVHSSPLKRAEASYLQGDPPWQLLSSPAPAGSCPWPPAVGTAFLSVNQSQHHACAFVRRHLFHTPLRHEAAYALSLPLPETQLWGGAWGWRGSLLTPDTVQHSTVHTAEAQSNFMTKPEMNKLELWIEEIIPSWDLNIWKLVSGTKNWKTGNLVLVFFCPWIINEVNHMAFQSWFETGDWVKSPQPCAGESNQWSSSLGS